MPRAGVAVECIFSSRRRHTRGLSDWSSDVCSSDLWNISLSANATLCRSWSGAVSEIFHHAACRFFCEAAVCMLAGKAAKSASVATRWEDSGSAIWFAIQPAYPCDWSVLMSAVVGPNVAWVRKRGASALETEVRSSAGGGGGATNAWEPALVMNCPPSSPLGNCELSISTYRLPLVRVAITWAAEYWPAAAGVHWRLATCPSGRFRT